MIESILDLKTIIALVLGSVGSAIYMTFHKSFFEKKRVTEDVCNNRHDEIAEDLTMIRKMLHLVASKVGVSEDEMQKLIK